MLKIELHNRDTNGDPVPTYATDAEIELADQLRHQFEEQFLGSPAASAPVQERSSERH